MSKVNLSRTLRRKKRVSLNISGTADQPRISIFRSNKYIFAQAINDVLGNTVVSVFTRDQQKKANSGKKTEVSKNAGGEMGKKLLEKKIKKAVFDRGVYSYKGRLKMFAEGLREAGITM